MHHTLHTIAYYINWGIFIFFAIVLADLGILGIVLALLIEGGWESMSTAEKIEGIAIVIAVTAFWCGVRALLRRAFGGATEEYQRGRYYPE